MSTKNRSSRRRPKKQTLQELKDLGVLTADEVAALVMPESPQKPQQEMKSIDEWVYEED
jgi:hypothetical protein